MERELATNTPPANDPWERANPFGAAITSARLYNRVSRRCFLRTTLSGAAGAFIFPSLVRAEGGALSRQVGLRRAIFTMGSILDVTAYGESRNHVLDSISRVFAEFRRFDALLSVFDPRSQLCAINRNAGKTDVPVSPEVYGAVVKALTFSRQTGGRFDPTIEPYMRMWGFRAEHLKQDFLPSDTNLRQILTAVGTDRVTIDARNTAIGLLDPRSALDLGGIAVGLTLDRAIRILRQEGIESAFVNHSGDAYALGAPPESEGWEIGIPNPLDPAEILHSLAIRDRAVATSGSYEHFVEIDGKRYGHILDPRSGEPVKSHLSVTVLASSAIDADALSTALFTVHSKGTITEMTRKAGAETIIVDTAPDDSLVIWSAM